MVSSLENKVDEIRQKAKQKNHSFGVVESRSENMVVVVISGTPAMFLTPPDNSIIFMKVNILKWSWAKKEGFSSEDIFDLDGIGKEVFTPTTEENILKYLELD